MKATCPYCRFSREIPSEKIPPEINWATCPRCGQPFEIPPSKEDHDLPVEKQTPETDARDKEGKREQAPLQHGCPWEDRSEVGLWPGLYGTIRKVLFSPDHFFKALLCNGGIRDPLAFGLLVGSFGAMLGFFWQFLLLSGGLLSMGESFLDRFSLALVFLIVMVILPVYVIVKLFVNSGIVHLLLRILGAEKKGFEATFRVMAYSRAAHIWALIPFIGGWVGGAWQVVVQVIGLRRVHETSYLRVILAFAIPLTFAFLLVIGVLISVFVYLSERGWI